MLRQVRIPKAISIIRAYHRHDIVYKDSNYKYISDLAFVPKNIGDSDIPLYRAMDLQGKPIPNHNISIKPEILTKMHQVMVSCDATDNLLIKAQRQGKISFYIDSLGETAGIVGTIAALQQQDMVFPQYRESGAHYWRGYGIEQWVSNCTSSKTDYSHGRNAPVCTGKKDLNIQFTSPPLATQTIHSSGAGYAFRIGQEDRIAITFIGDGAASEGDFHAAMNFAATLKCQTLFVCRNNEYAISTPSEEQFAVNSLVTRAHGYGVESLRVDGNDAVAVYEATQFAREYIVRERKPVFIELVTYRFGHHSTSDYSALYREDEELESWIKHNDPLARLQKYLIEHNIEYADTNFRKDIETKVKGYISKHYSMKRSEIEKLFTDVYDKMTPNLIAQHQELRDVIKKYPDLIDVSKYEGESL